MDKRVEAVKGTGLSAQRLEQQRLAAKRELQNIMIRRESAQDEFQEWCDLVAFNPLAQKRAFERLEDKLRHRPVAANAKTEESDEALQGVETIAKQFHVKNSELNVRTLLAVLANIKEDDDIDTILKKVTDAYPDHSLADETLAFLIEGTKNKPALSAKLNQARNQFNELYGREIRAGKNIQTFARDFSEKGLGSPTALRDLYRDLTGNPREPHLLFEELTTRFRFKQMKAVIDFILHSLGADMKAKGPSISRAELERLFVESRKLQAFLGLFQFFQKRMSIIKNLFEQEGLTMPPTLNFELLAKQLMRFLQQRYPSADKVLQMAFILGIAEELAAQIIVFSSYRDALRNISPRLFKSERHRQDLLMTLIEALSDLEDMIDEEEEEEE